MAGLVAVMTGASPVTRGPVTMIAVNDRDNGDRPNLVMVTNIVRIELVPGEHTPAQIDNGLEAMKAAGFQVR